MNDNHKNNIITAVQRLLTLGALLMFIFAILSMSNSVRANNRTWDNVVTSGPIKARHEAGLIALNNKIYLLGGRGIKPVNVFDLNTNTWQTLAKPPLEIHHFQPVIFNEKIYVVGAMTGRFPNETPLENVLIFDPKNNTWQIGDQIPENRRRGGAGVSIYNNKIYLSAGITHGHMQGSVTWFDEYNPATHSWQVLADAPNARDHFQSSIINGKLYAAGGRTTSKATKHVFDLVVTPVDVYDFSSKTWQVLAKPLPTGRAGTSTFAYQDLLLVVGGESGNNQTAHADVEIYDTKAQQWYNGPALFRGRHGSGIALVDGYLWTASGSGNRGGSPELTSTEKLLVEKLQQ